MNKTDKYSKVIEVLKGNKPVLVNKEKLTDDVMIRIQEPVEKFTFQEKLSNYLFGWADIGWIRGTMAIAAMVFIGIFIIQQLVITDRINSLEKQLIRTVNTINTQEPELGIMQKVLLNIVVKDQLTKDSITISRSDLEELLNSYLELQENYDNMEQNAGINSYIQKMLRRNLEEGANDDESELKL
ncbi:MAG: hypothetical protein IMY71_15960 [Bacteroidetes bacterium]|nr:hypothetical protein [Bacteroidota bacterium]